MDIRKIVIPAAVLIVVSVLVFYFFYRGDVAGAPFASGSDPGSAVSNPKVSEGNSPSKESTEPVTDFAIGHNNPSETADTGLIPIKPDVVEPSALPEGAVASVNDVPITKAQLEIEFNRLLISPTAHSEMKSKRKDDIRQLALQELVVRELAYQEAKNLGLKVSSAEISASFERIRKRYKDSKGFEEALKAEEMTEPELRARIEKDLLLAKVNKAEIEDKAVVTDKEARDHYESNKGKFTLPESLQLWQIFTKVEGGNEAEAKLKIDKALKELRDGKDFGAVAYQYSEDEYRVLGGKYGSIHRGQLEPSLESAVFAAKENEATGPFRTAAGWHIVKVLSKRSRTQLGFDDVKDNIKKSLYQKKLRKARLDFINRLRNGASVKYVASL